MIYDTDVLIWALRNNGRALQTIDDDEDRPTVSVVSYLELLYGAHDKRELAKIRIFIQSFKMLTLKEQVGSHAAAYLENYALNINMDPMDALIAATAVENNLPLCTGNIKHFRHIPNLQLRHYRP